VGRGQVSGGLGAIWEVSVLENPYFPGSVFPLLGGFLPLLVNFVSFLGSIFHFWAHFQFPSP
jgi:hypothetical protein